MFLMIAGSLLGLWLFASAWKFYRNIDWNEPPDYSPDLKAMHKKQAELQHIQDVLEAAVADGKLSGQVAVEFNRYAAAEIAAMDVVEKAWKNRPRKVPAG